jgi:hypothetical protein
VLDARRQSLLIAGLAGLGAGALGWLVLGSAGLGQRLEALEALGSNGPTVPPPASAAAAQAAATARARPLFQTPGQGGAPATVRLDGVSVRPGLSSALVAIGGAGAQWLAQGETAGGVTVAQVRSGGAVIETSDGQAMLGLGQTWSPAAPSAGPPP